MKKKVRSVSTLFLISMLLVTTISIAMLGYFLISQLGGTLKLNQKNGRSYTITF